MYFPISGWFTAFVLTVAIEAPVVWILLRDVVPDRLRLVLLILFANLATHVAVWYVVSQLADVGTLGYTVVAETWAIVAESVFYWAAIVGLSVRRAAAVALAANLSSFIAGRVVVALWPDAFL